MIQKFNLNTYPFVHRRVPLLLLSLLTILFSALT